MGKITANWMMLYGICLRYCGVFTMENPRNQLAMQERARRDLLSSPGQDDGQDIDPNWREEGLRWRSHRQTAWAKVDRNIRYGYGM